ncbi:hypothetical protein H0H81_003323 [Sphagnurus paluster]|uniref:GATA-type domain-containing protein n=1 Tax=Sphagnurus paluster TaxID=117069 RepID=A0A9P7K7G2_9AGAR|nr:hypothetical protein H0H81_003323 [Sphagnurus paluster]
MASDSNHHAGPSTPKTFEFTKRKRWADLVTTELAEGINIILSVSCSVLYCAPAVTEITGWRENELIDCDFISMIATPDDQAMFRASFEESIEGNTELHAFVRIKCSEKFQPPGPAIVQDMLFEIKGQPRSADVEGMFFFATAKPYPSPSRNTEMLFTFLDLKVENDELQRRRLELLSRLPQKPAESPLTVSPSQIYVTSPIQSTSATQSGIDASGSCYPSVDRSLMGLGTALGSVLENAPSELQEYPPSQALVLDEEDEGSRRKKLKKTPTGENYVCITCGRTDSPEWRKGPLGPKTLCNACGLRWAKQTRTGKVEETEVGYDG